MACGVGLRSGRMRAVCKKKLDACYFSWYNLGRFEVNLWFSFGSSSGGVFNGFSTFSVLLSSYSSFPEVS